MALPGIEEVMDLTVGTVEAQQKIAEMFEFLRAEAAKNPAKFRIALEMDEASVKGELARLADEIKGVSAAVDEAEKEFKQMHRAADEAMAALKRELPDVARQLQEAAKNGPQAINDALDKIKTNARNARSGAQGEYTRRTGDARLLSELSQRREGAAAAADNVLLADNKHLKDLSDRTLKLLKAYVDAERTTEDAAVAAKSAPNDSVLQRALIDKRKAKGDLYAALEKDLGNDSKRLRQVVLAFKTASKSSDTSAADAAADRVLAVVSRIAQQRADIEDRRRRLQERIQRGATSAERGARLLSRLDDRRQGLMDTYGSINASTDPSQGRAFARQYWDHIDKAYQPVATGKQLPPNVSSTAFRLERAAQAGNGYNIAQANFAGQTGQLFRLANAAGYGHLLGGMGGAFGAGPGGPGGPGGRGPGGGTGAAGDGDDHGFRINVKQVIADLHGEFAKEAFNLKINAEHIRKEISTILHGRNPDGPDWELRLGVDRDFFLIDLAATIEAANAKGYKIHLGADVAAAAATVAKEVATETTAAMAKASKTRRSKKADEIIDSPSDTLLGLAHGVDSISTAARDARRVTEMSVREHAAWKAAQRQDEAPLLAEVGRLGKKSPTDRRLESAAERGEMRNAAYFARNNPQNVFAKVGDRGLWDLFMGTQRARGSGDIGALSEATSKDKREALMRGLNAAAGNANLTPEVRHMAQTLAQGMDKILIRPLLKELGTLQAEQAATVREAKAETKRRQREQEAQDEVNQRVLLRSRIKSAFRGDASAQDVAMQSLGLNPKLMQHVASMRQAFAPAPQASSPEEAVKIAEQVRQTIEEAREARRHFQHELEDMIAKEGDLLTRAGLKQMLQSVNVRYGTEIARTENRDRLAPIKENDKLLSQARARQEWDRMVSSLFGNIEGFNADRPDFGAGRHRDYTKEAKGQYQAYITAVRKHENAILDLRRAITLEEKEDGVNRLRTAQETLKLEEERLRVRLLVGAKDRMIDAPDVALTYGKRDANDPNAPIVPLSATFGAAQRMSKAEAYYNLSQGLRASVGQQFEGFNAARSMGGVEVMGFGKYTDNLFSGGGSKEAQDVQKEFLRAQGATDKLLNNTGAMKAELDQQLAPLRAIYELFRSIDGEAQELVDHLNAVEVKEKRVRDAVAKQHKERAASMAGYKDLLRNAFAMAGGFSLGYTAVSGLRNSVNTYMQYKQELAEIQGVVRGQGSGTAGMIDEGIGKTASKYGMNLLQAAQAARVLSQAGFEAKDVIVALDRTLMAARGMGMTIEQVQELQIALRAATEDLTQYRAGIDYVGGALERISAMEARYAVTGQDLANSLKIMLPILDEFGASMVGMADHIDYANSMTTTLVSSMRITGNQAANAEKMLFSRLTRPEVLKKLQDRFQLNIGTPDGKDILPLDRLLYQMGRRFEELNKTNPFQAKQLAVELSGGRNISQITKLLQEYRTISDRAVESSLAFGTVQTRTALATDTLLTSVERVRTNFHLFNKNLLDSSSIARGLTVILGGLADVMGGMGGSGGGGGTALVGLLAGGAFLQGTKGAYSYIQGLKTAGDAAKVAEGPTRLLAAATNAAGAAQSGAAATSGILARSLSATAGAATGMLGSLAKVFGTGTIILAGIGLITALIGKLNEADGSISRFRVQFKTLDQLDALNKAPQMQEFALQAQDYGLGSVREAYDSLVAVTLDPTKMSARMKEVVTAIKNAGDGTDLDGLRAQFQKVLVEDLAAMGKTGAKEGFGKIIGETERAQEAVSLFGKVAFSANMQIAQSLDSVREATRSMVETFVTGIDAMDMATRDSKMKKILGAISDMTTNRIDIGGAVNIGRVQRTITNPNGTGSVTTSVDNVRAQILNSFRKGEGTNELADMIERNPALTAALTQSAESFIGKAGTKYGDVINRFFETVGNDPNLKNKFAAEVGKQVGADPQAVRALGGSAAYQNTDQDFGLLVRGTINTTMGSVGETLVTTVRQQLEQQNPVATPAMELFKRLQTPSGRAGALDPDGKNLSGANTALLRFKDALLNTALTLYETMRKLSFDEAFARANGQAFDRGQAMFEAGRSILQQRDGYGADQNSQMAKLQNEYATLQEYRTKVGNDRLSAKDKRKKEIEFQLAEAAERLQDFQSNTLSSVFSNTFKGREIFADLQTELKKTMDPASWDGQSFEKALQQIGQALVSAGRAQMLQNKQNIQDLELERDLLAKQAQLQEQMLPTWATATEKAMAKAHVAAVEYQTQARILDQQRRQHDISEDQYRLDRRKLDQTYETNRAYEARLATISAQQDLDRQIMSNMEGSLSGIKNLFSNTSVWEEVYDPKGDTAEDKHRAKAQAIRKIIFDTISPIFKTVYDRMVEQLFQSMMKRMMGNFMKSLFGLTEQEQAAEIQKLKIIEGAETAAILMKKAIIDGAVEAGIGKGSASTGTAAGTTAAAALNVAQAATSTQAAKAIAVVTAAAGGLATAYRAIERRVASDPALAGLAGGDIAAGLRADPVVQALPAIPGAQGRYFGDVPLPTSLPDTRGRYAGQFPAQYAFPANNSGLHGLYGGKWYVGPTLLPKSLPDTQGRYAGNTLPRSLPGAQGRFAGDRTLPSSLAGSNGRFASALSDASLPSLNRVPLNFPSSTISRRPYGQMARSTDGLGLFAKTTVVPVNDFAALKSAGLRLLDSDPRKGGIGQQANLPAVTVTASPIRNAVGQRVMLPAQVITARRPSLEGLLGGDILAGLTQDLPSRIPGSGGRFASALSDARPRGAPKSAAQVYANIADRGLSLHNTNGLPSSIPGSGGRFAAALSNGFADVRSGSSSAPVAKLAAKALATTTTRPVVPKAKPATMPKLEDMMSMSTIAESGPITLGLAEIHAKAAAGVQASIEQSKLMVEAYKKQQAVGRARNGAAVGMMAGNMLGTMAGKGGPGAQMGSQIGSSMGGMVAMIPAIAAMSGPFAPLVGLGLGVAGGLLGGWLGGKTDKKEEQNQPVIKGLEAIERAQRETITTIQGQTDALLKPENRLMNLPSSFNIPRYQPAFAGTGAGTTVSEGFRTVNQFNTINLTVPNGDPNKVRDAVKDALTDLLNTQRRNGGW